MRITMISVGLFVVLASPSFAQDQRQEAFTAGPLVQDRTDISRTVRMPDGRFIAVLKPEVVKDLQILPLPTPPTAGISVGTYWACSDGPAGFDLCDLRIVVCDDQGENCIELP